MSRLRLLALAPVLALLVACAGPEQAPESAFAGLPPQTYPFDVVWECLIEAAEDLEFTIDDASRDGTQGEFGTVVVVTFTNTLDDSAKGQRLQARIQNTGDKQQAVQLAASELERQAGGSWTWARSDDALRARFEDAYHTAIRTRYRAEPRDEGF